MNSIKNRKKRILVVTQNFYPESFGINDIVANLVKEGFEVDVLTGLPNYPQGKFYKGYGIFQKGPKFYKGARVYRCVVFPRLINSKLGICLNYITYPLFATIKSIRLIFKKYDKIFAYVPSPIFTSIPAQIISTFRKCEKIIYVLDIWPESVYSVIDIKNKFIRKILKSYSGYTYRSFDRLLVCSKGFIPQLEEYGIDSKRITYLPQWFPKIEAEKKSKSIKNKFRNNFNLVFTGNIGIPQNLSLLIEGAELLKKFEEIKFIIVGDGDYLPTFKEEVKKRGLSQKFVFTGRKPFYEMPLYYEIADGLIATLKDIELFSKIVPAKIPAYMNAGKPILCAINGEAAELIAKAKCGFSSNANDYKEFARNVIKLYKMPKEERKQFGSNGQRYSREHFNREKLLLQLKNILEN